MLITKGFLIADGDVVAVVDVIHITHAAVATVSSRILDCSDYNITSVLFFFS